LIASFGLVMNSTAIIIGAMLVAPLMTPILGLGLGLARGEATLIRMALRAEVTGIVIAVGAGALFGLSLPYIETTPEMLGRTTPNLLDLLVAVFAGSAGAYALVDEKLSPALPGVAISTAIVPPLANCGLSLSLGAHQGAWGSFLLFFTNFLSILLVSAVVFYHAGMAQELKLRESLTIARRYGIAGAGFVLIAVTLSGELLSMFEHQRLGNQIKSALQHEFARLRVSKLETATHERRDGILAVLAEVNAPNVVSPQQVDQVQQALAKELGEPVDLYVRSVMANDVSATGSIGQTVTETLDGFTKAEYAKADVKVLQIAEQAIREYLGSRQGIHLQNLEGVSHGSRFLLKAEITGVRRLRRSEIAELDALLQERVPKDGVELLVLQGEIVAQTADSALRMGMAMQHPEVPVQLENARATADAAREWFNERGYWLERWSYTVLEDIYHFLLEVTSPTLFSEEELKIVNEHLSQATEIPFEINVRSVPEIVLGPQGQTSLPQILDSFIERNRAAYEDQEVKVNEVR
jgi:uncharacterized hydrophobic protein (TIGR00271 family)